MEWIAIAIASTVGMVLAFLVGRKQGRAAAQVEIDTLTSEKERLSKEVRTLSDQVSLSTPKKGLNASIKDAIGSISVPSFGGSKTAQPKSLSASSGNSSRKSSSRSSRSTDSESFLGSFLGGSLLGGDYGGGGNGGGTSDSGGSYGGGSSYE